MYTHDAADVVPSTSKSTHDTNLIHDKHNDDISTTNEKHQPREQKKRNHPLYQKLGLDSMSVSIGCLEGLSMLTADDVILYTDGSCKDNYSVATRIHTRGK